jgi:hypothetical protein
MQCLICGGDGGRVREAQRLVLCDACADGMTDEAREERERILAALEHAPQDAGRIAPGLRGWWTPAGWYVCAHCAGRILARGSVAATRGSTAVWADQAAPYGVCVGCEV